MAAPHTDPVLGSPFLHHGRFAWSDVIIDIRPSGPRGVGLPASLTEPDPGGGVIVTTKQSVRLRSAGEEYRLTGMALTGGGAIPAVLVLVECPGGFRVGLVSAPRPLFGAHEDPEAVWSTYASGPSDELGYLFTEAYPALVAGEVCRRAMRNFRAFADGAVQTAIRVAALHPDARGLVLAGALRGVSTSTWEQPYTVLAERFQGSGVLTDDLAAGWAGTEEDLGWLQAFREGRWEMYGHRDRLSYPDSGYHDGHVAALEDVHDLRTAGWSLEVIRAWHTEEVLQRVRRASDDFDPAVGFSVWAQVTDVEAWVAEAGSPLMASLCVEVGLSLDEVRALRADGALDESALRTLLGLLPQR